MYPPIPIIKVNFQEIMISNSLQCPDIMSFVILVGFLKCYLAGKNNFFCWLHYNRIYNHAILSFSHLQAVIILLWYFCKYVLSSERWRRRWHITKHRSLRVKFQIIPLKWTKIYITLRNNCIHDMLASDQDK